MQSPFLCPGYAGVKSAWMTASVKELGWAGGGPQEAVAGRSLHLEAVRAAG